MGRPTNGSAIAALVTGLMGFAIVPIALGHLALRQIRRRDEDGAAMAVIGLVLGYGALALYLLLAAVVVWGVIVGAGRR
ncbi:MAG: DUF4190 domain-containing protein [Dermatophilaceae bacterium]